MTEKRLRGKNKQVEQELLNIAQLNGPQPEHNGILSADLVRIWRETWVICPAIRALAALRDCSVYCKVCRVKHYPHEAG